LSDPDRNSAANPILAMGPPRWEGAGEDDQRFVEPRTGDAGRRRSRCAMSFRPSCRASERPWSCGPRRRIPGRGPPTPLVRAGGDPNATHHTSLEAIAAFV
jgi:hypothetical protein